MRVFKEKQPIDNYTGCVLIGQYACAYFPVHKNRIIRSKSDPEAYILEYGIDRSFKLTTNDVAKFIADDAANFRSYVRWGAPNSEYRYSVTLESYIKGQLELQINFPVKDAYAPSENSLGGLIAGFGCLLSNLTDQRDFRIEYIHDAYSNGITFYNSKTASYKPSRPDIAEEYVQFGISFAVPDEFRTFDTERIMLCAIVIANDFDSQRLLLYYLFKAAGYIVHEKDAIYLFRKSPNNTILAYEFNGKEEFDSRKPKELVGLSWEDIMGMTSYNGW